jgi:hypothetical protein
VLFGAEDGGSGVSSSARGGAGPEEDDEEEDASDQDKEQDGSGAPADPPEDGPMLFGFVYCMSFFVHKFQPSLAKKICCFIRANILARTICFVVKI